MSWNGFEMDVEYCNFVPVNSTEKCLLYAQANHQCLIINRFKIFGDILTRTHKIKDIEITARKCIFLNTNLTIENH